MVNQSTGKLDRNGNPINTGDIIRCWDGPSSYTAVVVFKNCAFRACPITNWYGGSVDGKKHLPFNSSLLFKETVGTSWIEVL